MMITNIFIIMRKLVLNLENFVQIEDKIYMLQEIRFKSKIYILCTENPRFFIIIPLKNSLKLNIACIT